MKKIFEDHFESELHALKVYLLNSIVEDLKLFENLQVLNSIPFERYNVHIKSAHRATSRRHRRGLQGTAGMNNSCHICTMTSFERICFGQSQPIVENSDRIVHNRQILVRDEVKTR